jgi:hypothetical protein
MTSAPAARYYMLRLVSRCKLKLRLVLKVGGTVVTIYCYSSDWRGRLRYCGVAESDSYAAELFAFRFNTVRL